MMGRKPFRQFSTAFFVISTVLLARANADSFKAELSSTTAIDGSLVRIQIKGADKALPLSCDFKGEFDCVEFTFFPGTDKSCEALFAVPFNSKPGSKFVKIRGKSDLSLNLEVKDGNYPAETLKVDNKHVNRA